MKKILILQILLIMSKFLYSQEYKEIDSYSQMFIYKYSFCDEKQNAQSVKVSEMVLEVGKKYSKFCSTSQQYADSLYVLYANESPEVAFSIILPKVRNLDRHSFCKFYVFKRFPSTGKTVFISSDMASTNSYKVIEEMDFGWKIDNSAKKSILGYSCTKATCSYAGRNYEAWFTTEIPISDGPYKFSGLPGLIVKIADDKEEHTFELQEVKNVKSKAMYFPEKKYIETDSKGFVKAFDASKSILIARFEGMQYTNDDMRIKAVSKVQKRNNFIEQY